MNARLSSTDPLRIENEIARLRAGSFGRLGFPSALEQHFGDSTREERTQRMTSEGWLLTLTYALLVLADWVSIPERFHLALFIRCGLLTPLLVLLQLLVGRNPPPYVREVLLSLATILVAGSNFFLYRNLGLSHVAAAELFLLVALLGSNVVLRLRHPFAIAVTVLCLAGNSVAFLTAPRLTRPTQISWSIAVIWGALFILLANYSLERQERLNFLLLLRHDIQTDVLTSANSELKHLSTHDALTGIPNRVAFNRKLAALWEQARKNGTPLSVVLLDIDHFKIVNDTQGHLYGDEVLKRVSALLMQSLRGKNDVAARFGGEEFILLLPETNAEAARKVAERIRILVQVAGSPAPEHEMPPPGLWTTISCGCATVEDTRRFTAREMIHAADRALYAAKSAGRNRVASAPVLTSEQTAALPPQRLAS